MPIKTAIAIFGVAVFRKETTIIVGDAFQRTNSSSSSFSEEEEESTENDFNHECRNASSGVSLSSGSHSKHFCKNCANFIEHPRPSAFLRPSAASLRREAFSRAVSKGKNKEDDPEDGAAGAVVFEVVVSKSSSSSSRC